jgi:hypothetical protein
MEVESVENQNTGVNIQVVEIEKETFYKISNQELMRPFLMNIVSNSNHWMYISSNGGLTAGRKNPEYALFPYYTDDKLSEFADITGSKTIFQITYNGQLYIWEPYSNRNASKYKISRNLYKNIYGNKVIFEETNHDLGTTFRYQWNSSNLFGFVKKAELINHSLNDYKISVVDGIQNVMPFGVNSYLQTTTSNLVDAYKRSELHSKSGLGIFALSAIISDKAEPSESLKANIAWSLGHENPRFLLSSLQLDAFRNHKAIHQETDIKGEKGAYFIGANFNLSKDEKKAWQIVANVNQDQTQVINLCESISSNNELKKQLFADIELGTQNLRQLLAQSDGLQVTADKFKDARHLSNVLFNIMRGGIFDNNYQIEKHDFVSYLAKANKVVFESNKKFVDALKEDFSQLDLEQLLSTTNDVDLIRLSKEYLPLKFSRRHGDPSRPWNKFSINTNSEIDGSKILDYEGNWRDIFQNWEALVHAYPEFIEGMIFKFLNASTFDGYNPYRITKDGFDWEIVEPDNPWSYIGYWGDHQIIYLLKFLEFANSKNPNILLNIFNTEHFVYANVPYRIKPYSEMLIDPKNTIDFNEELDIHLRKKMLEIGADGSLLCNKAGEIYHVNFLEKILATVLSKTSNFIPEGGIWMNTQRPEWNDANNALVGNGVSMVTLNYLRRFFNFLEQLFMQVKASEIQISEELASMFNKISSTFSSNEGLLVSSINNKDRRSIVDALCQAGSDYRETIYDNGFSGNKAEIKIGELNQFVKISLRFFEHTIATNKRKDHLYHAYNLVSIHDNGELSLDHLSEMLEGQVAAISSGYLSSEETLSLLDSLRKSALYRADQNSYLLYPNKALSGFLQKNNVPEAAIMQSQLLQKLVNSHNHQIIIRDVLGHYHFNGNFKNAGDLNTALNGLEDSAYTDLLSNERALILQIFETVFNHKSFTGRSGTFYSYEGLGSIYWHMVSKLYLAVQEACINAIHSNTDEVVVSQLLKHFYEIGDGIGIHKSPELYGAFPTDPYSHTPMHRGAQQPGMTGQVKEDILVRIAELGVFIQEGKLGFNPLILRKSEFLKYPQVAHFIDINNQEIAVQFDGNAIGFTICQVPVIYNISDKIGIEIKLNDGTLMNVDGFQLDELMSSEIFKRTGNVLKINVFVVEQNLRR